AFDTEGGDSIKRGAAVLEAIIRRASRRGKGLPTSLTLVPTTLSPPRRVEAVADDGPDVALFRGRAGGRGAAETLHGWWNLETPALLVSNLSLKLYHGGKLRWGYQQFMTEAPNRELRRHGTEVRCLGCSLNSMLHGLIVAPSGPPNASLERTSAKSAGHRSAQG